MREVWIDDIKSFACILVVLGHFTSAMVSATFLPRTELFEWFQVMIYYFHVPLFFICSGYLYQKYSNIRSTSAWAANARKKLLALGVPYLVFCTLAWAMKTLFASDVTYQVNGLAVTLLWNPVSPYWYLYCLLLFFLVTPTQKDRRGLLILACCALAAKLLYIFLPDGSLLRERVPGWFLNNWIWFAGGMLLPETVRPALGTLKESASSEAARYRGEQNGSGFLRTHRCRLIGLGTGALFLVLSIWTWRSENELIAFLMAILACVSVFLFFLPEGVNSFASAKKYFIHPYTFPIYLMHLPLAAGWRILLLKLGVGSAAVHIVTGLLVSIFGPIFVMVLLEKCHLDFIIYPQRLLRAKKK